MMRMLAILTSIILVLACQQQREPPAAESTTAPAADASLTAVDTVVPVGESTFFESAMVGTNLDADGAVQVEVTTLKRSGPIYATVRAKQVPGGLAARASWFAGTTKVAEETKPIPPDKRFVTFQPPDTKSWKPGNYTVELWLGGNQVAVKQIKVVR